MTCAAHVVGAQVGGSPKLRSSSVATSTPLWFSTSEMRSRPNPSAGTPSTPTGRNSRIASRRLKPEDGLAKAHAGEGERQDRPGRASGDRDDQSDDHGRHVVRRRHVQAATKAVQRRALKQDDVQRITPDLQDLEPEQLRRRDRRGHQQLQVAGQEQVMERAAQAGHQRQHGDADQDDRQRLHGDLRIVARDTFDEQARVQPRQDDEPECQDKGERGAQHLADALRPARRAVPRLLRALAQEHADH